MTTLPGLLVALVAAAAPSSRGEVLDFSATWCGPCQSVAPTVARLERDGYPIRSVDVDQNRALAQRFNVTAMPTFVLVVDGKEVDRHEGIMSESDLKAWLNRIPRGTPANDLAALETTRGQSSPFVADPNVRLGNPGTFATAETEPRRTAELETRPAPARSQPSAFPEASNATDLADRGSPLAGDIRASNSPLTAGPSAATSAATPFSASVLLRATIDGHVNLGSGTIIQCENGRALILTCGHIFRASTPDTPVEVNFFDTANAKSSFGRIVKFDLESDVGLVAVETDRQLPFVAVAREEQRLQVQEPVINIGCSGGQNPTTEDQLVTAVNPYIGPDNLECTGVPVQGRSGGGLFRTSGELAGICIAADPKRKRGVYAGLLAVHKLLDGAGYASLYRAPEAAIAANTSAFEFDRPAEGATGGESLPARNTLLESLTPDAAPGAANADAAFAFTSTADLDRAAPRGLPVELNGVATDAEVVCIIRSRNPSQPDSQVVIIHQASPKLLSYLRGEMGTDVSGNAAAALLSHRTPRRSREESIPTMGVAPESPLQNAIDRAQSTVSQKPALQPTAKVEAFQPRRYVRSR